MNNTVSAAVALPTAIVIALGGLLMTTPAAHAETAPVEQVDGAAAPVAGDTPRDAAEPDAASDVGDATPAEPSPEEGDAGTDVEAPVAEEVPDGEVVPPVAEAPVADGGVLPPAEVPVVEDAAAADEAAAAPGFEVTSPTVQGELAFRGGVVVAGTVPEGSSVSIVVSNGTSLRAAVTGTTFREAIAIDPAPSMVDYQVTVTASAADGSPLGSIVREVLVLGQLSSDAPVITSPVDGSQVDGDVVPFGDTDTRRFVVSGTGTPGELLDIELSMLDPQRGWGYGHDPVSVGADGTWSTPVWLPVGLARISIAQQSYDEDGFATTLPSAFASIDVRVGPAPAPVVLAPSASAPVVAPVVAPSAVRPAAVVPRTTSSLAHTGTDETTPWAGALGLGLMFAGFAGLGAARRRARRA
jgi:LPXTG-motif cell wall-anchored protein